MKFSLQNGTKIKQKKPTPDTDNWNTENAFNENSPVSLPRQGIGQGMRQDLIKLAALYYTRV